MNVGELIERLKEFPPNAPACCFDTWVFSEWGQKDDDVHRLITSVDIDAAGRVVIS